MPRITGNMHLLFCLAESGIGRFCCRSRLMAWANDDSVAVTQFAAEAGDDGAAEARSGAAFLQFQLDLLFSRPPQRLISAKPTFCHLGRFRGCDADVVRLSLPGRTRDLRLGRKRQIALLDDSCVIFVGTLDPVARLTVRMRDQTNDFIASSSCPSRKIAAQGDKLTNPQSMFSHGTTSPRGSVRSRWATMA